MCPVDLDECRAGVVNNAGCPKLEASCSLVDFLAAVFGDNEWKLLLYLLTLLRRNGVVLKARLWPRGASRPKFYGLVLDLDFVGPGLELRLGLERCTDIFWKDKKLIFSLNMGVRSTMSMT